MKLPALASLPRGVRLERTYSYNDLVRVHYATGDSISYFLSDYADKGIKFIWANHFPSYRKVR